MSLFYVGVLTSSADELESTEGRLLVFRVDDDFTRRTPSKLFLSLVAWAQVPGWIDITVIKKQGARPKELQSRSGVAVSS